VSFSAFCESLFHILTPCVVCYLFVQYQSIRNSIINTYGGLSVGESVASSAVKTAIDIQAKLIVVLSDSGKMANYVARFRPVVSAMMVTPNLTAARQASGILLGMHTLQVDSLEKTEELIEDINFELVQSGMLQEGDSIIVVAGRMAGMKEQLRVVKLGPGKAYGHFVQGGGVFFNRDMLLSFSKN
jgi:pyruvate kinase